MKRVLVAGGYSLTSVVAQGLTRLLYSVLIARFMAPGSLSETNALISIAMFAALLWPASVANASTMFISRARGAGDLPLEHATLRFLKNRALLSSMILGLVAGIYSATFYAPADLGKAAFAFLIVLGFGLSSFVRGILYATERIPRAAALDCAALITALAGLGLVIWAGYDTLLLLPLVTGYALVIVLGWPTSRAPGGPGASGAPRREIDSFVAWGTAGAVATGGFLQVTMIIAHSLGNTVSGDLYAAALTLATPAAMLTSVVSLVLFPSLSRAVGSGDHGSATRQTDWAMRALTVVLVATFGVLTLLAPLLLGTIYGEHFTAATPILSVLLIASLFGALTGPAADALSSRTVSGIRLMAGLRVGGFCLGLATCLALSPQLGTLGVALGYLGGMVIAGLGPIVYAWKRFGQRWAGLAVRFSAGIALLVGLIVAQRALSNDPVAVALIAAVFLVAWLLLSFADVRRMLGRRVRS